MKSIIFALAALVCVASASVIITPYKMFPDLPEEQPLNYTRVNFTNTLMKGWAALDNGMIYNLHQMDDDCSFSIISLKITCGEIILPAGQATGDYEILADIFWSNGTVTPLDAAGELDAIGQNIRVNEAVCDFTLNIITQKISIKQLTLTPSLEGCKIHTTGDDLGDGQRVDWETVCKDLSGPEGLIATFWGKHGTSIMEDVRAALNVWLKDKTLQDIIDIINPPKTTPSSLLA